MDSKSGSSLCYDHFGYNANRVVSQSRSLLFVAAFDCCQTDWVFFVIVKKFSFGECLGRDVSVAASKFC